MKTLPLLRNRTRALAFVAILVAATLVPLGFSNQIVPVIDGLFHQTGPELGTLQDALSKAVGVYDPVAAAVDRIVNRIGNPTGDGTSSPTMPYFLDFQFDPVNKDGTSTHRIGGVGDWTTAGDAPWISDTSTPHAQAGQSQGVAFRDASNGGYPIGLSPLNSFYMTPRISLRSLPTSSLTSNVPDAARGPVGGVVGPDAAGQVDAARTQAEGAAGTAAATVSSDGNSVGGLAGPAQPAVAGAGPLAQSGLAIENSASLANGQADPHRILLHLDHRFNFAFNPNPKDKLVSGYDGGRVELYVGSQPSPDDLAKGTGAIVISPISTPTHPGSVYQATRAFQGNAFTGASPPLVSDIFDLTPYAGKDVWVVFHAATVGWGLQAKSLFADSTYFDLTRPPGWTVEQVRVEGPAFPHNVRIEEVVDPAFLSETPGLLQTHIGANHFSFLLVNRGLSSEDVIPTLDVQPGGTCTAASVHLRPGDLKRVQFDNCDAESLAEGTTYSLTFKAPLSTDMAQDDNQASVNVAARASVLSVSDGDVGLRPQVGDGDVPRELSVPLRNWGLLDATVHLALKVQFQPDGQIGYQDVTDPQNGLVQVDYGGGGPQQDVVVPANPHATSANALNAAVGRWSLTLPAKGNYKIQVTASQDGQDIPLRHSLLEASTAVSLPLPYATDFTDPTRGDQENAVVGSPLWTTRTLVDTLPPQCTSPSEDAGSWHSECPTKSIWEITGVVPASQRMPNQPPMSYVLSGQPDATKFSNTDQFTALNVQIQYVLQGLSCGPDLNCGSSSQGHPWPGPATIALAQFPVDGPISGRSAQSVPSATSDIGNVQQVLWQLGSGAFGDQSANSNSANRFLQVDGQWTREEQSFPVQLTGAQVSQLALQFRLDLPQDIGLGGCPATTNLGYCPTWRVAFARVTGTIGSTEHEILRFDGNNADVGKWTTTAQTITENEGLSAPMEGTAACLQAAAAGAAAAASATLHCAGWTQRDLTASPLSPVTSQMGSPWHSGHPAGMRGMPNNGGTFSNGWSTASVNGNSIDYASGLHGLLVSPALRIPSDGADPQLTFGHIFNLDSYGSGSNPDIGYADSGAFMMRFMDQDPSGMLHATTQFMPVALQKGSTGTPYLDPTHSARFTGNDCSFYQQTDLQPLDPNLPSLLSSPVCTFFTSRQPARYIVHLNGADGPFYFNYTKPGDPAKAGNPSDPDKTALQHGPEQDLRGRIVQFAFRADSWPVPSTVGVSHPSGSDWGWVLTSFGISEPRLAYDVAVTNAQIRTSYNWRTLGLGPGTSGNLDLTVQNNGLFKATGATVKIQWYSPIAAALQQNPIVASAAFPVTLNIASGEQRTVTVPLDVPVLPAGVTQNSLALGASVTLSGYAIDPPAPNLHDDAGADNCALMDSQSSLGWSLQCDLGAGPAVLVRSTENLKLQFTMTPLADRVGSTRILDMQLQNQGNVVVHNAIVRLERTTVPTASGQPVIDKADEYLVASSPAPGTTAPLNMLAVNPPVPLTLVLDQKARYLVIASVRNAMGDPPFSDLKNVVADSFLNFYSDDFSGHLDMAPGLVDGSVSGGPGWAHDANANFLDQTSNGQGGAWRFGDGSQGTYPDGTDSWLNFPSVDLSTAKRAVFTVAHKETLEKGFDGTRLEARLDGTSAWVPLTPTTGYPGAVQPNIPLNGPLGQRDPSQTIPAFTGDSNLVNPGTKGWANSEFDLGQIPGLTVPVQLERLSQDGFKPYPTNPSPHVPGGSEGASQYTHNKDWCDSTKFTLGFNRPIEDVCWQRWNLAYGNPQPDPEAQLQGQAPQAGHQFWWGQDHGQADRLTFNWPASLAQNLQRGDRLRLTFWVWELRQGSIQITEPQVDASRLTPTGQAIGGWVRYQVTVADGLGRISPTTFAAFQYNPYAYVQERGGAIDDVRLEVLRTDASGQENPTPITSTLLWPSDLALHANSIISATGWTNPANAFSADNNDATYSSDNPSPAGANDLTLGLQTPTITAGTSPPPFPSTPCTTPNCGGFVLHAKVSISGFKEDGFQFFACGTGSSGPVCTKPLNSNGNFATDTTIDYDVSDQAPSGGWGKAQNVQIVVRPVQSGTNRDGTWRVDAAWATINPSGTQWSLTNRIPDVPDAWNILAPNPGSPSAGPTDHDGKPATVWVFGNPTAQDSANRVYPRDAQERLLTPFLSLREVGGTRANLTYWEQYELPNRPGLPADIRSVYIRSLDPQLDGSMSPGPWQLLSGSQKGVFLDGSQTSSSSCSDGFDPTTTNHWCPVNLPINSSYIGRQVQFAFEMKSNHLPQSSFPKSAASDGYNWKIDQVGIQADSLVGRPVQLRMHVGTDASLHDGGMLVDNPRLVGFQYQRNTAILLDGAPQSIAALPSSTLRLHGTVRNLGARPQGEPRLALQVTSVPLGLDPPNPLSMAFEGQGIKGTSATGTIESNPFQLAPAGDQDAHGFDDRLGFTLALNLPSTCSATTCSANYRLEFRLLDLSNGQSYLVDENLGDHEVDIPLMVAATQDVHPASIAIAPMTQVNATHPIALQVALVNAGTQPLDDLQVQFQATRYPLGGDGTPNPPATVATGAFSELPQPGSSPTNVTASWTPGQPGLYRLEALLDERFAGTNQATTHTVFIGHALVGTTPLYWHDDFKTPNGWTTSFSTPSAACSSPPTAQGGQNPAWHTATWVKPNGDPVYVVGIDPQNQGQGYPTGQDQSLTSPAIDLRYLTDLSAHPSSPFLPDLTFRYQSILGRGNNGVIVQAAPMDSNGNFPSNPGTLGSPSYNAVATCPNPLADPSVVPVAGSNPSIHPVLQDNPNPQVSQEAWQVATAPQASVQIGKTINPLVGNKVQETFRFGSGDQFANHFAIDSVALSSYRVAVTPTRSDVQLSTGAAKSFLLRVTNTGAANDTFALTVDPAATDCHFLPPCPTTVPSTKDPSTPLEVEILPHALPLAPGQSALVTINVTVPDIQDIPQLNQADLGIQVASSMDPNQAATSIIRVDRLAPTPLPRLVASIQRAHGSSGVVNEQAQVPLVASVSNTGQAPSKATSLIVFACPALHAQDPAIPDPKGQLTADISDCKNAFLANDTSSTAPILIYRGSVPCLLASQDQTHQPPPQDCTAQTFTVPINDWKPPVGRLGLFHIVGVADPRGLIHQFISDADVVTLAPDLEVLPLLKSTVAVRDFHVWTTDPNAPNVRLAFAGQLLHISGNIVNIGNAPADDVQVFVTAQSEILHASLGRLKAGENRTVQVNWLTTPGNVVIGLRVTTASLTSATVTQPVAVQRGNLQATLDPDNLLITAGQTSGTTLHIANLRNQDVSMSTPMQASDGLTVSGLPGTLTMPKGTERDLVLTITASPFAPAGIGHVHISLVSAEGAPVAAIDLPVTVTASGSLTVKAEPLVTAPGTATSSIHVANNGQDAELHLQANAPEDWNITLPLRTVISAGGQADIQALVTVPTNAPPGPYNVSLQDGGTTVGSLLVRVLAHPSWRIAQEAQRQEAGITKTIVRATNTGNAPGIAPLGVNASVAIDPVLAPIEAGQTIVYTLTSAYETTVPTSTVEAPTAPEVVSWQIQPEVNAHAGDPIVATATLHNPGPAPIEDAPVRAYVDGRLVAASRVQIAPGQTTTVALSWTAAEGDAVLVLSAGQPGHDVAQSSLMHVAAPASTRAAPAAGPLLMLGLAGAAIIGRRRKE